MSEIIKAICPKCGDTESLYRTKSCLELDRIATIAEAYEDDEGKQPIYIADYTDYDTADYGDVDCLICSTCGASWQTLEDLAKDIKKCRYKDKDKICEDDHRSLGKCLDCEHESCGAHKYAKRLLQQAVDETVAEQEAKKEEKKDDNSLPVAKTLLQHVYCPECKKEHSVLGTLPEIYGGIPVLYASADVRDNFSAYGLMECGEVLPFQDDSTYECYECGAKWKNTEDFVSSLAVSEVQRYMGDDDADEEDT